MLPKKVYNRGKGDLNRSIRITNDMEEALAQVAERAGISVNAYICWVLDEHLQRLAEAGELPWPKGYEVATKRKR